LAVTVVAALLLWRRGLWQSVAIGAAVFLFGATLAARQRDVLASEGLTIRQWQQQSAEPDAGTRLGRTRLFFLHQRARLLERYREQGLEGQAYALVAAMTLGDRSALDRGLRATYNVSGASHVLALSGLHMGILYALLSLVMLPARRKAITQLLLVLTFWAFALLTGLSVSVVRSALMLSLVAVFSLRSARGSTLNLLALAAIIILAINPDALYDVGFQLSFLSVFSILLLMPVLNSFWSEDYLLRHRLVALVWQLGAVSVAAQMGVAPLLAHYFGQLPVYFIATSMVVIPAAYAVLWLSVLFLLFPLSWIGQLLLGVVDAMNGVLTSISHWPGATISGLHLSVFQVVMAYVALAALYMAVLRWQGKKTFFTT
jgi:competence protein ComEC